MSGVLRWEDPPPADKRGGRITPRVADWYLIAAQLRGRPGEWAAITDTGNTTLSTHIRQGTYAAFRPAGAFDSTGRRVDGKFVVYARYLGSES